LFLGAPGLDFSSGNGVQVPSLFNTSGGLIDFINWDNHQQQVSLLSRGASLTNYDLPVQKKFKHNNNLESLNA